jgi:hypothetical protein
MRSIFSDSLLYNTFVDRSDSNCGRLAQRPMRRTREYQAESCRESLSKGGLACNTTFIACTSDSYRRILPLTSSLTFKGADLSNRCRTRCRDDLGRSARCNLLSFARSRRVYSHIKILISISCLLCLFTKACKKVVKSTE